MKLNAKKMSPYFRVFGFGLEAESAVNEINALGIDGLKAFMATKKFRLAINDKMVILLTGAGHEEEAESTASRFRKAGVLTLAISPTPLNLKPDSADSVMTAGPAEWTEAVKGLVTPLLCPGLINYDFNDLVSTLQESQHFHVYSVESNCDGNRLADAIDKFSRQVSAETQANAQRISIILFHNSRMTPPLTMGQSMNLREYISQYPEDTDIIWAIQHDDTLPTDTLRLTAILAGKGI